MKSTGDSRWGHALLLAAVCFGFHSTLSAAPPVVSNIRAAQRPGTHLVDIYYNLAAAGPCTVYVAVSDNAGANWNVPVFTLTGAVGPGVAPGNDRLAIWNAGTDWPGRFNNQCKVRIVADDGNAPAAPTGMAYIPGGPFTMGDPFSEGGTAELPPHNVFISPFFMDKFEVRRELWLEVYSWAIANGYSFSYGGSYKNVNHPVHTITWYDAVKWCNARSEKENLTRCYYNEVGLTTVYKTGTGTPYVNWSANGYRLPTEAEWEKAARGGLNGKRFPWGDTISHSQANYAAQPGSPAYDVSPTSGFHPVWATGGYPYTSPVGSFAANGFGLYDMAGNLWEWCWDWYDSTYYGQPAATQDNPRGPVSGSYRLLRGGNWGGNADVTRCAARSLSAPSNASGYVGFRCVRGL